MSVLDEANRLAGWIARRQQLADAATVCPWSPTVGGVVAPYPEPLSSYGGQLTARTLAAGAAVAARDAARVAALATLTRDLITGNQYDLLMAPWRTVIGDQA